MAQQGRNRKKAVVIISDGNDTSSHTDVFSLKQLIRETEVLVYAVGIDGGTILYISNNSQQPQRRQPPPRMPIPFPFPGRRPPQMPPPQPPQGPGGGGNPRWPRNGMDDRVNVAALRDITDDSGGRTEIIRWARDLDPATAGIADELSKQDRHRLCGHRSEGRSMAHDSSRRAPDLVSRARAAGVRRGEAIELAVRSSGVHSSGFAVRGSGFRTRGLSY